jgi:hypothetical protein
MPKVRYCPSDLVIEIGADYEIDLEEITDSAALLDWILQVNGKRWCDPWTLKAFLNVLNVACRDRFGKDAQGVFCPFEEDHDVDWKRRSSTPKRDAPKRRGERQKERK